MSADRGKPVGSVPLPSMASEVAARFATALTDAGVGLTRTDGTAFVEDLREAVETPAVGVPLPDDDLSLAAAGVDDAPSGESLDEAATGVTPATLGVADYGSVVLRQGPDGDEPVSLYPPRHVAVLAESDVVPDVATALDRLDEAGVRDVIFATGPSATADMGELVNGVHGPRDVHVLLLEDR